MKKKWPKVFGVLILIIGVIAIYGIITGKLDKKVHEVENEVENQDSNDNAYADDLPEGVITDYQDKFEWITKPITEVYDPNSKLAENGAYGFPVDSRLWQAECTKDVQKYIKDGDLDLSKSNTTENYNIKAVHNMNEEIEMKPYNCKVCISNMKLNDNFEGFSNEYFVDDTYNTYNGFLQNNSKVYSYVYDENEQLLMQELSGKVYFVTFDIEVKAESNWVQEIEVVPQLLRTIQDNETINIIPPIYTFGDNNDFELTNPIYMDIGLYDLSNYGNNEITLVPMRKGECLKFTCGFLIPEEIINECMLTFNTPYYTDYYADPFRILVKVK